MPDREKVIKGLECCIESDRECICPDKCPYADAEEIEDRCETQVKLEALALLNDQTAEAEMEGGGSSWWFACGECRGAIDSQDKYCRHCGRRIIWHEL